MKGDLLTAGVLVVPMGRIINVERISYKDVFSVSLFPPKGFRKGAMTHDRGSWAKSILADPFVLIQEEGGEGWIVQDDQVLIIKFLRIPGEII